MDEALDLAAQAVNVIVNESILIAMNRFNRKNKQEEEEYLIVGNWYLASPQFFEIKAAKPTGALSGAARKC